MAKHRRLASKRGKPEAPKTFEAPASQPLNQTAEKVSRSPFINGFNIFLLAGAVILFAVNQSLWGKIFLVGAFVLQFGSAVLKSRPMRTAPKVHSGNVGWAWLFWIAFSLVLLTFPNFSWIFPAIRVLPFQQSYWVLLILFMGLVWAFRRLPEQEETGDIASSTARFWLGAALLLTALLNFHQASSPVGSYWNDNWADIDVAHRMKDTADYYHAFIFMDWGSRQTFSVYLSLFLWHLLPGASSLFIMRLGSVLCNLGTVWLLYLIGKEIGGRRTGVLSAAMGAVSEPLIHFSLLGDLCSMPLAVALAFLFFFRLLKNPDLKRFLQWGAALSFGVYTYSPYRLFIIYFIFTTMAWVFFQKEGRSLKGSIGPIVWISAALFFIYFLYTNNGISSGNWISLVIDASGLFLPCVVMGGFLTFVAVTFRRTDTDKSQKWVGWMAGAWLCIILSFPIMANEDILRRMAELIRNNGGAFLSAGYILKTLYKIRSTVYLLFFGGDSVNAMPGDSFFGFSDSALIALGISFFLAKPKWKETSIFLGAIVGFLPYALADGQTSARTLGCIVPFLLLAALGLNELLKGFSQGPRGKAFYYLAWVLLLGFWGLSSQWVISRMYDQWSDRYMTNHVLARSEALQDRAAGHRIYFDPPLFGVSSINEGNTIYAWLPHNLIDLSPDEKPQDVAIILEPDTKTDQGALLKDELIKEFPKSQWNDLRSPMQNSNEPPALLHCLIPFSDIIADSQKHSQALEEALNQQKARSVKTSSPGPLPGLFEVHQTSGPFWRRQFTNGQLGLAFDMIDFEDKVANVNDPAPFDQFGRDWEAARYQGTIHINDGGDYEVTWKTGNRTQVRVDGKTILDLYFPRTEHYSTPDRTGKRSIHLDSGDHQVEVTTCFQDARVAPDISIQKSGTPGPGTSLWSTFNF